jgi:hypothetical protein
MTVRAMTERTTPERTLTERELNRALLARQLLLERATLPMGRAIERVGGLQTQNAPSGYVGLWSRVEGFGRDDLTRALERRAVVQGTMIRVTIHTVTRADYPIFVEGVREARRAWWVRATRGLHDERTMANLARATRALLADGPLRTKELQRRLDVDSSTWNGIGLWIDLVRVPPSGTWERPRADLWATAEDWLGPLPPVSPEESRIQLVKRYLAAFGPASAKDVANWTGLPMASLAPVLSAITLRRFRDERGGELLDLPRAPLPDPETPAPIRFIPTFDATLLVQARRTQILPERYRPIIFNTKTPHSTATFLVDGQVAGTWRVEKGDLRVTSFEKLPARIRRELDEEADRLRQFYR